MNLHRAYIPVVLVVALGIVAVTATSSRAVDEFHAFLLPATNSVDVDSLVQITFEVDETARQFNAYQITIEFDPSIVSFQGVAEGDLMVNACPDRYSNTATTDSTVTYDHILLCDAIDGPGVLSIFTFQAIVEYGTSPLEITTDPNRAFLDNGLYVWPGHAYPRQVFLHNSAITVGGIDDVGEWRGTLNNAFKIQVTPNPIQDGGWIRYYLAEPSEGVTIEILDVTGRQIRHWGLTSRSAGTHELQWEGTDLLGRSLPVGTYFYRARSGSNLDSGKFQVVQ